MLFSDLKRQICQCSATSLKRIVLPLSYNSNGADLCLVYDLWSLSCSIYENEKFCQSYMTLNKYINIFSNIPSILQIVGIRLIH